MLTRDISVARSYPVSQFLTTYRIPLPPPPATYSSPWLETFELEVAQTRLNAIKQTKTVDIVLHHPGIMWPVIAFDADVVAWGASCFKRSPLTRNRADQSVRVQTCPSRLSGA